MGDSGLKSASAISDAKLFQHPLGLINPTGAGSLPLHPHHREKDAWASLLLTKPTSPALVEGAKTWSVARECGGRGRSWDASGEDVGVAARVLAWRGRKS